MGPIGAMSGEDEMDKCGNAGVDDVNAELLSFFFSGTFSKVFKDARVCAPYFARWQPF